MTRVLITEDEQGYVTYLNHGLTRRGYDVRDASNVQTAISLGSEFNPDILVVDWFLKSSFHGLKVRESLCHLNPKMQTVVITGYATDELREDVKEDSSITLLEKPFQFSRLEEVISQLKNAPAHGGVPSKLGTIEMNDEGKVVRVNDCSSYFISKINEIDSEGVLLHYTLLTYFSRLQNSPGTWVPFEQLIIDGERWIVSLCPKMESGNRLLLLLRESDSDLCNDPSVYLLSSFLQVDPSNKTLQHVVIAGSDESMLLNHVKALEKAGIYGYGVVSVDECKEVINSDSVTGSVLLLDSLSEVCSLNSPIEWSRYISGLKKDRPDLTIIGESSCRKFFDCHVDKLLPTKWRPEHVDVCIRKALLSMDDNVH